MMDPDAPIIPTMITIIRHIYRERIIIRIMSTLMVSYFLLQAYLSTTTIVNENRNDWELHLDEKLVESYADVFQDLIDQDYLTFESQTLVIGIRFLEYTTALNLIGVPHTKSTKKNVFLPYQNESFDFQFLSHTSIDCSSCPGDFAFELFRTLKPQGYVVIHTQLKDDYSLNSLLNLFESFKLVQEREFVVDHWAVQGVREVVLMKEYGTKFWRRNDHVRKRFINCFVPKYKKELMQGLEVLMDKEPLMPLVSGRRYRKYMKYLTSMVDISFKASYVYIDVGAKSFGTSIGSWFKRVYPKQNKPFKIFAIEGNKQFHQEYKSKKKVTLLPFAAWVRNETLFFEINRALNNDSEERGTGMGRMQSAHTSTSFMGDMNKIQGFDFVDWVMNSFSEKDFVVVKMDVEGREFDLIAKMVETGTICLIDELFLECHYDPKEKCCDIGERSSNYQKGFEDCLELYRSLRDKGVFVHQWFT